MSYGLEAMSGCGCMLPCRCVYDCQFYGHNTEVSGRRRHIQPVWSWTVSSRSMRSAVTTIVCGSRASLEIPPSKTVQHWTMDIQAPVDTSDSEIGTKHVTRSRNCLEAQGHEAACCVPAQKTMSEIIV